MNDVADELAADLRPRKNGQKDKRKEKEEKLVGTGGESPKTRQNNNNKRGGSQEHKKKNEVLTSSGMHPSHPSSMHSSGHPVVGEDASKGRRKKDWKDGQGQAPLQNGNSHPSHTKNNIHGGAQYGLRQNNPNSMGPNHVHGGNNQGGPNHTSRQVHGKPVPSSLPVGAAVPAVTPARKLGQNNSSTSNHGYNNHYNNNDPPTSDPKSLGNHHVPGTGGGHHGSLAAGHGGHLDGVDGGNLNGGALLCMLKANTPKIMRYTKEELLSIGQLPASKVKPRDLCSLIDKTNLQSPLLMRSRPEKNPTKGDKDGESLKTSPKGDPDADNVLHRRPSDQYYCVDGKMSDISLMHMNDPHMARRTYPTLDASLTPDKPNFGGIQRYSMGHVPTFVPGAGRAGEEAQKFDLWDSPNFVSSAEDADLSSITMGDIREVEQQMAASGLSLPEFKAQLEFRRKWPSEGGGQGHEFGRGPTTGLKPPRMLTEQDILSKGGGLEKWLEDNSFHDRGEEEYGRKVDVNDLFNSASGCKNLPTLPSAGDVPFPFTLMSRGKDGSGIPPGEGKGFPGKGEPLSVEEIEAMHYAHKAGKGKAQNTYVQGKGGANYPPQYSAANAIASAAARAGYRSSQEKGYAGGKYGMQHPGIPVMPHPGAMAGYAYGKPDYYGMHGGYFMKGGSQQHMQQYMGKGYGKDTTQWLGPGMDYYQQYKGSGGFPPPLAAASQYPQFPPAEYPVYAGYSGGEPPKEEDSSCTQS